MLKSLLSGKIAQKLLFFQFIVLLLLSILFGIKNLAWGLSALIGGLAIWIPNVMFALFAGLHQTEHVSTGKIAISFFIGEAVKIVVTIVLLVVALWWFKALFFPLGTAYLAVLFVQILAPAIVKSYPN